MLAFPWGKDTKMTNHRIVALHTVFFKSTPVFLVDVKQPHDDFTYILLTFIECIFILPIEVVTHLIKPFQLGHCRMVVIAKNLVNERNQCFKELWILYYFVIFPVVELIIFCCSEHLESQTMYGADLYILLGSMEFLLKFLTNAGIESTINDIIDVRNMKHTSHERGSLTSSSNGINNTIACSILDKIKNLLLCDCRFMRHIPVTLF